MDSGVVGALIFGVAIIVVAIGATRLFSRRKRRESDRNASERDGDAAATWIGISSVRRRDFDEDNHSD